MMQGFPTSAKLPEEFGFGERFWYWRGVSGQSYIHSIYQVASCPPLPGAVYVLVQASGGRRRPLAVGRFPTCVDHLPGRPLPNMPVCQDADEIHVHLLARGHDAATVVLRDLEDAMHDPADTALVSGFPVVTPQRRRLLTCG